MITPQLLRILNTLNTSSVLNILIIGLLFFTTNNVIQAQTFDCDGPGEFVAVPTDPIGGSGTEDDPYLVCSNSSLTLTSTGVNPSLGFPAPGVIYLVYTCPPTQQDPNGDPCNAGFVALNDMDDNVVIDSGEALLSLLNLPDDILPLNIFLIPMIASDITMLDEFGWYEEDCTGIDLDFDYPVFTIQAPEGDGSCVGDPSDCMANGGEVSTDSNTIFCSADEVAPDDVVMTTDGSGEAYVYFITNEANEIVAGPIDNETIDVISFIGFGENYNIYGVAYEGELPDFTEGDDIDVLNAECSSVSSNAVEITTLSVSAGDISTEDNTDFLLCTDEDKTVNVTNNGDAAAYGYVLTDENDIVIGLIQADGVFDFNGNDEPGVFHIYGVASADDLPLIEPGANVTDIIGLGCIDITFNFIEVTLSECTGCEAAAGFFTDVQEVYCEGEEIIAGTEGANDSDAYEQLYVLVSADDILVDFSGSGGFESEVGIYTVCAINYLVEGDIQFGNMLEDLLDQLSCYDTTCVTFNVFPPDDAACFECSSDAGELPEADPFYCADATIDFEATGFDSNNEQVYILTDEELTILEISTDGTFEPTPGNYIGHALNTPTLPNTDLVGLNAADVLEQLECFDLLSFEFVVLNPISFSISQECDTENDVLTVTIAISGGVPQYAVENGIDNPAIQIYEVEGNIFEEPFTANLEEFTVEFPLDTNTDFNITATDVADCVGTASGTLGPCDSEECLAEAGTLIAPANTVVLVGGTSEAPSTEGASNAPGYSYIFLLTYDADQDPGNGFGYDIIDYNETGEFDLSGFGVEDLFIVVAISIEGTVNDFDDLLADYPTALDWEAAIENDDVCASIILSEFGYVLSIEEDVVECEADAGDLGEIDEFLCAGTELVIQGNEFNEAYAQAYILTDTELNIIDINTSGEFSLGEEQNTFIIHALNLPTADVPANLEDLIGSNAADVLETLDCYDLASSSEFVVLAPLGYTIDGSCDEDGNLTYAVSFTGGLPAYDDTTPYFVQEGDAIFVIGTDETFDGGLPVDVTSTWPVFDEAGCEIELVVTNNCTTVDPCDDLVAGTISTDSPTTFTVGDGTPDIVTVSSTGAAGSNFVYVITNEDGSEILAGPLDGPDFDFDDAPPGTCLIWGIVYEGSLDVPVGEPASNISSDQCFELTNSIAVTRLEEVTEPITIGEPIFTIDEENNTYTITFEIMGGSGNYEVTNGTINGSQYNSITFQCGQVASITITDDEGNILELTFDAPCEEVIECPGFSEAGTLTGANNFYCAGSNVIVSATGFNGTADYVQAYVATQGADFTIAAISTDGNFGVLSPGTYQLHPFNYYAPQAPSIPAIGESAADILAQTEACFDLDPAAATTIIVLEPVEIVVDYECNGFTGIYTLAFTFIGGLPQYVAQNGSVGITNEEQYVATGDVNGAFVIGDNIIIEFPENIPYQVFAADQFACIDEVADLPTPCSKTAIELLAFEGETKENGNLLTWITATEVKSDYFEIEKSLDGSNFETINRTAAAYNSNSQLQYNYLDTDYNTNIAYYRLKSVDINGKVQLSNIIRLERTKTDWEVNHIGPIPTNNILEIALNLTKENTQLSITILDSNGKILQEQNQHLALGNTSLKIDVSTWSTGIYFVNISDGNQQFTTRFVKAN